MRLPIDSNVTPHGAYRYDRGGGVTHWGVDLAGRDGTPVLAPEAGVIEEIAMSTRKPWTGYAPIVLMRGASGYYHLLAHTKPTVVPGLLVQEGSRVGVTGPENHVHWEVRRQRVPSGQSNTVDPLAWLRGDLPPGPREWPGRRRQRTGENDVWVLALIYLGLRSFKGWRRARGR